MSRALKILFSASVLLLIGCAQHHCRQSPPMTGSAVAPSGPDDSPSNTKNKSKRRVFVYKYDGSLQCKQGKAVPLDVMAKELGGITIFAQEKRVDGLMHIQVCGSPTGNANVFEISETDLALAEKAGFKRWTFE